MENLSNSGNSREKEYRAGLDEISDIIENRGYTESECIELITTVLDRLGIGVDGDSN